jgi:hypothetical protein
MEELQEYRLVKIDTKAPAFSMPYYDPKSDNE